MQPYFFPYIGYFQLIKAVDYFVIYDDVNYIKRGWVNKNKIWQHGQITNITLPVQKSSQNRKINQHLRTTDKYRLDKIKRKVQHCYARAPFFEQLYPLITRLIDYDELNLAKYLTHSLKEISAYLSLNTRFIYASDLSDHAQWDNAEQRIIDITRQLGGTEYYNLPGGKALYHQEMFNQAGIELRFISPDFSRLNPVNRQDQRDCLSIIDVLMYTQSI